MMLTPTRRERLHKRLSRLQRSNSGEKRKKTVQGLVDSGLSRTEAYRIAFIAALLDERPEPRQRGDCR